MIRLVLLLVLCRVATAIAQPQSISLDVLKNKIKGGWAGQTIGVTYGGPYEFGFQGTFINDYQPLKWKDDLVKFNLTENPGLFDDLYMDITFVDVFEKKGAGATTADFADAYAKAGYMLWHANQAGRYNLLHGIPAPQSGHWLNNPHADCIDFQIEADFAGLMSPGMPGTAAQISDQVGHIMNYGDGWYGGVYVSTMYSLAFVAKDIRKVVVSALNSIPEKSLFRQCIQDVINWHQQYPNDWHATWFEVQKKWTDDIGCPEGVFRPFNIDARVNAAYVVIGLLYGNGDFSKTLEIATRCGQDADCNPSSAGGILGTLLGYDNIPEFWRKSLINASDIPFKYTSYSLNNVYETGFRQAVDNVLRHGGRKEGNMLILPAQPIQPVRFEESFEGLRPADKFSPAWNAAHDEVSFSFEGVGFVVRGDASPFNNSESYVLKGEIRVDGNVVERPEWPVNYTTRRYELCWNYQLSPGSHQVTIKVLNPSQRFPIQGVEVITYKKKQ